jgi:hypothetical protein
MAGSYSADHLGRECHAEAPSGSALVSGSLAYHPCYPVPQTLERSRGRKRRQHGQEGTEQAESGPN